MHDRELDNPGSNGDPKAGTEAPDSERPEIMSRLPRSRPQRRNYRRPAESEPSHAASAADGTAARGALAVGQRAAGRHPGADGQRRLRDRKAAVEGRGACRLPGARRGRALLALALSWPNRSQWRLLAPRCSSGYDRSKREPVPIEDALGRSLAEPLSSDRDVPSFDNSAMDGFAVRAADTASAGADSPAWLTIAGESRAGAPAGKELGRGRGVPHLDRGDGSGRR